MSETAVPLRVQGAEVSVLLALILPSLLLGGLVQGRASIGFAVTAVATIARDLGLVALVVYFLWRNGEPVRRIGWRPGRWPQEALIGLLLFVPVSLTTSALGSLLGRLGLSGPGVPPDFLSPQGRGQLALAILLVAVVAVAEETIFRGYLLLRLGALTNSAAAVILSSIVFGLGHGYEGAAGMIAVTVLGAMYALVYLWRGSLTAPVVMHFMQDLVGIVLISNVGR